MTESKVSDQLEECFVRCRGLEVPLADRLQAFANEVRRLGPHFQTAVDALVSRLAQSNAGAAAPKAGEPMPAFVLPDDQGRLVRLEDLLAEGPVALAFNRGYWCPYCRINVDALARAEEEIAPERRHIAAIVPDRQKFAMWLKWTAQRHQLRQRNAMTSDVTGASFVSGACERRRALRSAQQHVGPCLGVWDPAA